MEFAHMLQGIIVSGFLGLVFGNFSTSPIYRLPRRESLFLRDPYCGDCNAKLMPKDLFPVFSWLMTRGKCRYCGAPVPALYACIEGGVGLLFVICYLRSGFSESFLLVTFGMTALIMIAVMLYLDNFFSGKTVIAALFLGTLYRTLNEGTLYNAAGGAFAGLMVGSIAWRYSGKELIRDIVAFPGYLNLLIVAGVWLPLTQFFIACLAAGVASIFRKDQPWLVEWTIIAYTVVTVCMLLH
jgi:prepilin signal peptidase PulO-like enzyme (type II secretory pathway)